MAQDAKISIRRRENGCRKLAAVALILTTGVVLCNAAGQPAAAESASSSHVFEIVILCVICAAALVGGGVALGRWFYRRRIATMRQRDEGLFHLIDQWTRSLQQEVAERKEAENALKDSQQFMMRQERLAAVGQLAAGLAHEFNNIMTIVQGHAALLMDNPELDEDSRKSLVHITDGVERTAKLIQQMLAFSRQQIMQRKPMDVQGTLSHTADMLGRLLGEDVTLRFEISPGLPPIMADSDMFQQIVVNLVVNARDAMSSGGQLTIRAEARQFDAADVPAKSDRKPGRFVRLSVTDTGTGMDTAIVNHLFEPFFTTKEVGKGSGLGLATVYGMVNQHQGWIEVESSLGHGTTFDIYFPVSDRALEKPAEKPLELEDIRGGLETILLVEDEEVLRELAREILRGHGYHVLEAANGVDALGVWERNCGKIDLLLTDIAMPRGISGRDLADRIWKQQPLLPVIFSSGYAEEMTESPAANGHGVAHLSKPYRPEQLVMAVRDSLDKSQRQGASVQAQITKT